MKNYKIIVFILTSLTPFLANSMSLNEALEVTYIENPDLEAAREELKTVDENAYFAISGFLPTINASYERGKRITDIGATSTNNVTDTKDISITQPIFNGGRTIAEMKQADHLIMSARANLLEKEQEVLASAVKAYMDIVRDSEVFELNKSNVDIFKKHLEVAKERFKLGEVTRTDVAQAEANLAKAISDKIAAEGNLQSSRSTFVSVIGREPSNIKIPDNPIEIRANLDELISLALSNNPTIIQAKHNLEASENVISVEKSKLLPSVNFKAAKQKQIGALFSGGNDIISDTYSVQMSVPLYRAGTGYSRVRIAKSDYRNSKFKLQDTENKVKESVIRAYNQFKVASSSLESNKSSVDAFKIALEGTEQEAKVGSRTTLDVLDAEQDLFGAKVNLISSKRDEIVSSYDLLAQVGRLNAKELSLNVELYDETLNYNKVKHKIIGF